MKLTTTINNETKTFTAKQIIAHKMPKIDSNKWTTRSVNIGGKFTKVHSRNSGSYFKVKGADYYIADGDFKNAKSAKIVKK